MKKLLSLLLTVMIFFSVSHAYAQSTEKSLTLTGLSEDYLEYLSLPQEEQEERLVPLPFEVSPAVQNAVQPYLLGASSLPEKYDLRDENVLTSVKNQGSLSICWSFAGLGLLESHLLKETGKTYDFSEMHTAYYMSDSSFKDGTNEYGWSRTADDAGNAYHFASYMYSGLGPVDDSLMPFCNPLDDIYLADVQDKPLSPIRLNDMGFLTSEVNMSITPGEITAFKNTLYKYGPLSTGIYLNTNLNSVYHNTAYNSFYNPDATSPNHAVTLVGWDDNFSKDNFSAVPPADGAWIVRNSWGASVMEDGYFYLSYYQTLFDTSFVYDVQDELGYDNIYTVKQNNYAGIIDGSSGIEYAANIFTKTQGTQALSEIVIMVSEPTDYEVYINPGVTDTDIFPDSIKNNCSASGTIEYAGYKTIKLDAPVTLTGDKFAVIVKYSGASVPITNLTASGGKGLLSFDGYEWIPQVSTDTGDFTYDCIILAYSTDKDAKAEVKFNKTPYYAQVSAAEDGEKISAKQGGIYSLLPGTYTYSAAAADCVSTPEYTFTITEADTGKEKIINTKLFGYDVEIGIYSEEASVSSIAEPTVLDVKAQVTALQGVCNTDILILAQYDKNSRLISTALVPLSSLTQESEKIYTYKTPQKISPGDTVKAYIWDGTKSIGSLSYAGICTVKSN